MFTKNDVPTLSDKDILRKKIEEQTKEFLAKGGVITELSHGESALEHATIDWESRQRARGKIHGRNCDSRGNTAPWAK